eukprot:403330864
MQITSSNQEDKEQQNIQILGQNFQRSDEPLSNTQIKHSQTQKPSYQQRNSMKDLPQQNDHNQSPFKKSLTLDENINFNTPNTRKRMGISQVDYQPSQDSYIPYFAYNMLQVACQIGILYFVGKLYRDTNITAYEIVYAQCAVCTLILFITLLMKNIYVLDVEKNQRANIIIKGFLYFIGQTFLYNSMHRLNNPIVMLIVCFTTTGVSQFFIEKHERREDINVYTMSASLILLLLICMGLAQPIISSKQKIETLNFNPIIGFFFSCISGIVFSFIHSNNSGQNTKKTVMLQNFYANCIAACFSPFLILKDISDRKKLTKYGWSELQFLAVICGIALIQTLWIDIKVRLNCSYIEKQQNNRQVIAVRFVMVVLAYIYCIKFYFS